MLLGSLLAIGTVGAAAANRPHNLVTPGTTVEDIARGNTHRCPGQPVGHKFHENVHVAVLGTPTQEGRAATDNVHVVLGSTNQHVLATG